MSHPPALLSCTCSRGVIFKDLALAPHGEGVKGARAPAPLQTTILTALLQPQPESYDLFDDVLLMAEGSIIYHGPRTEIVPFFESCGFKCPERKGVPDFLQEVTSRKDQACPPPLSLFSSLSALYNTRVPAMKKCCSV